MKLLVGSQALKNYYPNIKARDLDYFSDEPVEGADVFWHDKFLNYYFWNRDTNRTASLAELYTIKISHIFWDTRKWEKHYDDIRMLQVTLGKPYFISELYEVLYDVWEERYGKKKTNLNQEPETFFSNTVTRTYEHDSIHASVAYYDVPLFKAILRDGHGVAVDWNKFNALEFEDQLRLVREELYATALERYIIPSNYTYNIGLAYRQVMKLLLTSFWKGKWALFVAMHIRELHKPDMNYLEYHLKNSHLLEEL